MSYITQRTAAKLLHIGAELSCDLYNAQDQRDVAKAALEATTKILTYAIKPTPSANLHVAEPSVSSAPKKLFGAF